MKIPGSLADPSGRSLLTEAIVLSQFCVVPSSSLIFLMSRRKEKLVESRFCANSQSVN